MAVLRGRARHLHGAVRDGCASEAPRPRVSKFPALRAFQAHAATLPGLLGRCDPFRWMMTGNLEEIGNEFDLTSMLPANQTSGTKTQWVHEAQNQTALLEGFAAHFRPEESLCSFYAKHVPFVEGTGRILIGAGRIKEIGPLAEYARSREGMRGMLWERPIQHSIRPKGQDGFVMPYHEVLLPGRGGSVTRSRTLYGTRAVRALGRVLICQRSWSLTTGRSPDCSRWRQRSAALIKISALQRDGNDSGCTMSLCACGRFAGHSQASALFSALLVYRAGCSCVHALQQRAGENAGSLAAGRGRLPRPRGNLAARAAPGPQGARADLEWAFGRKRRNVLRLLSRFELTVDQAKHLYDEDSRRKLEMGREWIATSLKIPIVHLRMQPLRPRTGSIC